jgi:hypothetical protein
MQGRGRIACGPLRRGNKGLFFELIAYREQWKKMHVMAQRESQGREG